jgi:hypothetical protein
VEVEDVNPNAHVVNIADCMLVLMLGILVAVNTAGYALGAPFLNMIYDLSGSYAAGFITVGAIMLVVMVTVQILISQAKTAHSGVASRS